MEVEIYVVLDILLTLAHLLVITFNVLGWIWKRARKLHFISITLTALSWFLLGIWYGWGYCFLTDWHWKVKYKLGETDLPASFIKYFGDKLTGMNLDARWVDGVTLVTFLACIGISVNFKFFRKKK